MRDWTVCVDVVYGVVNIGVYIYTPNVIESFCFLSCSSQNALFISLVSFAVCILHSVLPLRYRIFLLLGGLPDWVIECLALYVEVMGVRFNRNYTNEAVDFL